MKRDPSPASVLAGLDLKAVNPGATDGTSWFGSGRMVEVRSPVDGKLLARVRQGDKKDYDRIVTAAVSAFKSWREVPAPKRGEIVRQLGDRLREKKDLLGRLVTLEMGKSLQEGWGEVQEMIDICDYACGQSRMLYGVQTHSERPRHRMFEQWQPLGVVGVITAFNFPVAVWSWNAALAFICGDTCVWKPASATPLTAIACQKIMEQVLKDNGLPGAISTLITGKGSETGEFINLDRRIPLVSYTGSSELGKHIGAVVGERLGRTILELGGNNAIIITPKANLALAAQNVFFGAVGTAGQRCTSTRRLIIEDSVYPKFKSLLLGYYRKMKIGSPLIAAHHMGPLVGVSAVKTMQLALDTVKEQGGKIIFGGEKLTGKKFPGGCYVRPAVVEIAPDAAIVKQETFAPILYLTKYKGGLDRAIAIQNDVPQGLSSSIFTDSVAEAERFLSSAGSDCGIANVNLGTSGAEIGLAFGGEKETGGGRESGSDAWKAYMRRQSSTVNWSGGTTLAQGITFE